MTRTMLAACAIGAFAASTTIGAQTPPPPKPQPSTPPMASQDKDTVTLTGCLKAWDSSVAGTGTSTTPSTTGTTAASKFMLTNVEPDAASATKPAAAQYYAVMAESSAVNLSAHLNHKVRVTGKKTAAHTSTTRPDPAKPGEPKPDPSKPSAGIISGDAAHKELGTVTVSSVTMISSTCPSATN
jgi:hypothetical protein